MNAAKATLASAVADAGGASADIPPDVWARLRGLRLPSRLRPATTGSGLHAGSARGVGQEFAQYRAYEPGDDLRHIDWKLYARTDRHYIRDATRDAPLTVWVLIDATASMGQTNVARAASVQERTEPRSPARSGRSGGAPIERKFDRAVVLAACIAELALQQGDRVGLVALGGAGPALATVDAATGVRHRDRIRLGLTALRCGGRLPDDAALAPLWGRVAADSLVVVLSDGYDDALVGWCGRLAAARRQLAFVQLLVTDERDFPFHGTHRFHDQETGATLPVAADAARDAFLARFADAQTALARRLASAGVAHTVHVLDELPDRPLHRLFARSATV